MWERVRWSMLVAALLAAGPVRAQTGQAQPPAPPPAAPPAQPAPGASTAGSQGQSSSAQPSSPGASSQQVVVNPPQPVPAAPPSSTTVPPPAAGTTVVAPPLAEAVPGERRRDPSSPLATVALDAGFGGVAGLLVGGGVALVEQGDHWGRDLMVGAGIGLIVGAAVGVAHAVYDTQQADRADRRADAAPPVTGVVARDGQDRTDRDPVITARTVGFAFRF